MYGNFTNYTQNLLADVNDFTYVHLLYNATDFLSMILNCLPVFGDVI